MSRASTLEPRGRWTRGVAQHQSLEQPAHSVRLGKAACRLDQGGCACGWLGPCQTVGALKQTEASEKEALRNRPVDRRAGVTSGGRERGEIDMGRQIGGAWRRERIGREAIADRLEAVAISTVLRAVVEEECGARMGREARAQ